MDDRHPEFLAGLGRGREACNHFVSDRGLGIPVLGFFRSGALRAVWDGGHADCAHVAVTAELETGQAEAILVVDRSRIGYHMLSGNDFGSAVDGSNGNDHVPDGDVAGSGMRILRRVLHLESNAHTNAKAGSLRRM